MMARTAQMARWATSAPLRLCGSFPLVAAAMLMAACATTGATFQSGVGDTWMDDPPYYAGAVVPGEAKVIRLGIHYQRGATEPDFVDPRSDAGSEISRLVEEMDAWLDSTSSGDGIAKGVSIGGIPPDVHFGCERHSIDNCEDPEQMVRGFRGNARMRLAVGRPSREWISNLAAVLDSADADYAMMVTLEVGHYWMRQSGLAGKKSVAMGTNYTLQQPWLTSLETPVSVLQLTGVLVGRDGRARRIGAEGILARRTSLLAGAFGLQRILRDEDIAEARQLRRGDLEGSPLAWKVALDNLVRQLGG